MMSHRFSITCLALLAVCAAPGRAQDAFESKRLHFANVGLYNSFAAFRSNMLSLVGPDGRLDLYDGGLRARDEAGTVLFDHVDCARYWEHITEEVKPWSYMKPWSSGGCGVLPPAARALAIRLSTSSRLSHIRQMTTSFASLACTTGLLVNDLKNGSVVSMAWIEPSTMFINAACSLQYCWLKLKPSAVKKALDFSRFLTGRLKMTEFFMASP